LFFNEAGQVRDKIRMGAAVGRTAIQPAVAVLWNDEAVAMMRPRGAIRRIFETRSNNGGQNWSVPQATDLPNPGGPVGLVAANSRMLVLVFNNDPKKERDLTLAVSIDSGSTWTKLATLDELGAGEQAVLTYPFLIRSSDGSYHLVYADSGKHAIRHIQFNDAWLESMLKQARLKQASTWQPNNAR
jgi:predicted neuraminidase